MGNESAKDDVLRMVDITLVERVQPGNSAVVYDPVDKQYKLARYDELIEGCEGLKEFLTKQLVIDFNDEDARVALKNVRAKVNSYIRDFRMQLNESKCNILSTVEAQSKEVLNELDDAANTLRDLVNRYDELYKQDKAEFLNEQFEMMKQGVDPERNGKPIDVSGLSLKQVFDPSWLNRSMPKASAADKLYKRLKLVVDFMTLTNGCSSDEAVEQLVMSSWEFNDALMAAMGPDESEQHDEHDDEILADDSDETLRYTVIVPVEDEQAFRLVMQQHGWTFNKRG